MMVYPVLRWIETGNVSRSRKQTIFRPTPLIADKKICDINIMDRQRVRRFSFALY